jgi:hypothetical protein
MISGGDIFSGAAVCFSGFSLWQTSLRGAAFEVFVPPIIRYASPYQNSIFEAFEIPITIINSGARTGTVLSLDLVVADQERRLSKRFYSACFGQWNLEKSRGPGFNPFAPISLAGRTSQSKTLQFYPRSDETVMQIVQGTGRFLFNLSLNVAGAQPRSMLTDMFGGGAPSPLTFAMNLPALDHRAFTQGSGSVGMNHVDWKSSGGA